MRRSALSLMPVLFVVITPYGGFPVVKASMTESFKLNQSLGKTLVGQAQQGIQSGVMPLDGMGQNASLSEESVSQENVSKALRDSEMGQYVLEQEKRPDKKHMVLDPQHDPLMKASTEVVQDPLKVLKADATVIREEGGEIIEEHLCEDPADPVELSCLNTLSVTVLYPPYENHIVTAGIRIGWQWDQMSIRLWNPDGSPLPRFSGPNTFYESQMDPDLGERVRDADPGSVSSRFLQSPPEKADWFWGSKTWPGDLFAIVSSVPQKGMYTIRRSDRPDPVWLGHDGNRRGSLRFEVTFRGKPEITEAWQSGCAALEALSNDEGKSPCDLIEEKCTQGPETRTINGVSVYRPCWQKTRTYLCGSSLPGTCGEYRIRGCSQTQSECISKVGEKCIRWRQTYQCKKTGQARTRTSIKGEGVPWCLDGDCYSPSWDANGDMLTAMSRMAVLSQIQKDMKDLSVFTGKGLQCRRGCLDFQNCCGTERGWGISLRFAACDDEEKLLAQKQKNGLCIFLGTYCSKRFLGACTQKKSTSCCYESRIARIVQVAAHQQLSIPWGSAEHPQCRGLTPEELSKVDLEKVDFRELYEEIMARYKAPQIITPQKDTLTTTVKGVSKGEPVTGKEGL